MVTVAVAGSEGVVVAIVVVDFHCWFVVVLSELLADETFLTEIS